MWYKIMFQNFYEVKNIFEKTLEMFGA